jgi:hypothetical protein
MEVVQVLLRRLAHRAPWLTCLISIHFVESIDWPKLLKASLPPTFHHGHGSSFLGIETPFQTIFQTQAPSTLEA